MNTLGSYIGQVQTLVNDLSGANFTQLQMTNFVNAARQRVSLDTHCVRYLYTGLSTVSQQETYLYNGSIGGVNLAAGGTNYTAPSITFSGGGGSGAAAAVTLLNGSISSIYMTKWGSNYTSVPVLHINDSTGSGATASAILLSNVLDILNISVIWGSERLTLSWLEFTRFQAFCRAFVGYFSNPGIFSLYQSQNIFYLYPIPSQQYTMELDVIQQSYPLVNPADIDYQIYAPYDDAVQFYAAFLALSSLQDERSKMWYDGQGNGIYETRIKQFPAQTFSRRIFNPYASGLPRLRRM